MKTKGFTLIVVLVVMTIVSTSAILIYTMTRDEMRIAAKDRDWETIVITTRTTIRVKPLVFIDNQIPFW